MKLQINASGAWRDVVRFEAHQLGAVKKATVPLAQVLRSPSFRVVEDQSGSSPTVVAYLDEPFNKWRAP